MKSLSILSMLLLIGLFGCSTDLEPKLRKSRLDAPIVTPLGTTSRAGVKIEYQVVYGLDLVDKVEVKLVDLPPREPLPVDGAETTPDAHGKGSFTIINTTPKRSYEYVVVVKHRDRQIPDTVFKGFITMP